MHLLILNAIANSFCSAPPQPLPQVNGDTGSRSCRSYGSSKKEYSKARVNELVKNYFSNSPKQLVSFFASNNKIKIEEADEIIQVLEKLKK